MSEIVQSQRRRVHTLYFEEKIQAERAQKVLPDGEVGTLNNEPVLQFLTEEPIPQSKRSQIDFVTCPARSVFNRVVS